MHPGLAFRRLLEPIGLFYEYYEAFRAAGIDAEVGAMFVFAHGIQAAVFAEEYPCWLAFHAYGFPENRRNIRRLFLNFPSLRCKGVRGKAKP